MPTTMALPFNFETGSLAELERPDLASLIADEPQGPSLSLPPLMARAAFMEVLDSQLRSCCWCSCVFRP